MKGEKGLPDLIYDAIEGAVGPGLHSLHEPHLGPKEAEYLVKCVESTYVSSVGPFVNRFEAELAEYTGVKYVVAMVNGTAALHISLLISGVSSGDEVLVPALSFVASANAVSYCNAIPHFVDCDEYTLGIDPKLLREYLRSITVKKNGLCINKKTGRVIRALMVMHTFGHPSALDELVILAADFGLVLVEDAAESLGSYYHGRHVGNFGRVAAFSFNGNKIITTGGGGAVLTNDLHLSIRARHISTTAKLQHAWEYVHDMVGYNYRLPNLNAALGCAQLESITGFLESKRRLFCRYEEAFKNISNVKLFREPVGCVSNYWLQTLVLDTKASEQRDSVLEYLNHRGINCRPAWALLSSLDPYKRCPQMSLSCAKNMVERLINIPSSAKLGGGITIA